jgi:hypothetical protein
MPMNCARCGAQNPDGNQFCSACGTPLTQAAAAAAPWSAAPPQGPPPPAEAAPSWLAAPPQAPPPPAAPPPAYASPQPAEVAYASPYYSPTGGLPQAPVHRTPSALIIGAVVALIVVLAGGGTAIALFSGKSFFGTADVAAPVPTPSPWTGATATNIAVTVPVPAGWTVSSKDNESISLTDPNGWGYLSVGSGVQSPKKTVQQQKGIIEESIKSKSPDAVECRAVRPTDSTIGGVKGISWHMCFTVVSSVHSVPAEASLFVATNADGSVWYGVILVTPQSYMVNLTSEAEPIIQGIVWKLT